MNNLVAAQREEIKKAFEVMTEIEKENKKYSGIIHDLEKLNSDVAYDRLNIMYSVKEFLQDSDKINANLILRMLKNLVRLSLDNFYSVDKNKGVPLYYKKVMKAVEKDLGDINGERVTVGYDKFYEHVYITLYYSDKIKDTYLSFMGGKPKMVKYENAIAHLTLKQLVKNSKSIKACNSKISKLELQIDSIKKDINKLLCLQDL